VPELTLERRRGSTELFVTEKKAGPSLRFRASLGRASQDDKIILWLRG